MSKKIIAISVVIFLAALVFLTYIAIPRISIALLAKNYGLNISCRSAYFTPHFDSKEEGGFKVGIDLRGVRISKKGATAKTYNDLDALVSAPFDGSLNYSEIKGILRPRKGHIFIDDLAADAGDIKVFLKGTFFYTEEKADLEIVIHFSQNLLKKVPPELSEMVLTKEPLAGWRSLSVNLKGSFKSPAIELTGRLFRLSIKEVSKN